MRSSRLVSYVRFAQQTQARLDEHVPLRPNFALSAVYTRMIPGFGGHPKFSKSIPGSAVDVATPPHQIHQLLSDEPPVPEKSATYQLMCQLPRYDAATLLELHAHYCNADPAWWRAVRNLSDYVIDLIQRWPR